MPQPGVEPVILSFSKTNVLSVKLLGKALADSRNQSNSVRAGCDYFLGSLSPKNVPPIASAIFCPATVA